MPSNDSKEAIASAAGTSPPSSTLSANAGLPDTEKAGNFDLLDDQDKRVGGKPSEPPDGGPLAWLQVAGSFAIFFNTWGIVSMYGVYQTYYQTVLLSSESESNISWIGALQGFLLTTGSIVAGPIYDAGYFRTLLCTGSFLSVLGMMLTSICTSYWHFVLAQGVLVGIGDGLLFLPSIVIISQYFTSKRAFATGIASVGSSIGGVLYPIVFQQLQPRIGFAWATRTIAFVMFGTLMISLVGMKQRVHPSGRRKLFDLAAFREKPYVFYLLGTFFGFMGIYVTFFYVQLYAIQESSMSPNLAFYLLSMLNAGSVPGRIIPTFLADILGPLNVQIFCILVVALLAFSWIAIRDTAGLVVFCVLYGFFFGPFVSLSPPIVVNLTSNMNMIGTRMGMLLAVSGLGLLIGNPVAGAIVRQQNWIGLQVWSGVLILASALFISATRVFQAGPRFRTKA